MLDKTTKAYYQNKDFMNKLNIHNLLETNAAQYDAIYFTGETVMYDFPDNEDAKSYK